MLLRRNFEKEDVVVLSHQQIQEIYTMLLKETYTTDIIYSEMGLYKQNSRVDIFKLKRSQRQIHIYEVKATRSDFLQDTKWINYLPFCNYFSFLVQAGVNKSITTLAELSPKLGLFEILALRAIEDSGKADFRNEHVWRAKYDFIPHSARFYFVKSMGIGVFIDKIRNPQKLVDKLNSEDYIRLLETLAFREYTL